MRSRSRPHARLGLREGRASSPFALRTEPGAVFVEVTGELDVASGRRLVQTVARFTTSGMAVRLDLDGVSFMDASGADAISEIIDAVDRVDGDTAITRCSPPVERIFGLLGLSIPVLCSDPSDP